MPPHPPPPIPPSFTRKKETILAALSTPSETYTDASPKGSVDTAIRGLIEKINGIEGLVTTSSCAGRVSVFVEGRKGGGKGGGKGTEKGRKESKAERLGGGAGVKGENIDEGNEEDELEGRADGGSEEGYRAQNAGKMLQVEEERDCGQEAHSIDAKGSGEDGPGANEAREGSKRGERTAVPGGKGHGGRWLFVSHELFSEAQLGENVGELLGLSPKGNSETPSRDIREYERDLRLILHIMAASLYHAQNILGAAINAGFRESGVQSLKNLNDSSAFPMVAVRTSGLGFESLIGYVEKAGAQEDVIRLLVDKMHLRLLVQIANERFVTNAERKERFENLLAGTELRHPRVEKSERQAQKRAEGLKRQATFKTDPSEREEENEGKLLDCLHGLSDNDGSQELF